MVGGKWFNLRREQMREIKFRLRLKQLGKTGYEEWEEMKEFLCINADRGAL